MRDRFGVVRAKLHNCRSATLHEQYELRSHASSRSGQSCTAHVAQSLQRRSPRCPIPAHQPTLLQIPGVLRVAPPSLKPAAFDRFIQIGPSNPCLPLDTEALTGKDPSNLFSNCSTTENPVSRALSDSRSFYHAPSSNRAAHPPPAQKR